MLNQVGVAYLGTRVMKRCPAIVIFGMYVRLVWHEILDN